MIETQPWHRTAIMIWELYSSKKNGWNIHLYSILFHLSAWTKNVKIHGKPASQAMILFLKSNIFLTATESQGLIFTQDYTFKEKLNESNAC